MNKFWKFQSGDDITWAEPTTNDSLWQSTTTEIQSSDLSKIKFQGIGWFRLHLFVPKEMVQKTFVLLVSQHGASEFYLDGKLFHSFGTPSIEKKKEEKYSPNNEPIIISFDSSGSHLLAVRYSNQTAAEMYDNYLEDDAGYTVAIAEADFGINNYLKDLHDLTVIFIFLFTFFITLAFVHFLLFLFYRAQQSNLYYSVFILLFSYIFLFPTITNYNSSPDSISKLTFILYFMLPVFFTALLGFIFSLFHSKIPKLFWIITGILGFILLLKLLRVEPRILSFSFVCMTTIISSIEVFKAIIKKKKGAWAVCIAAISFLILILIVLLKNALGLGTGFTIGSEDPGGIFLIGLLVLTILGIPVSMSVYLARDFAVTSKNLSKKLIEVEELSEKSIEQEKEKQKILATQNEVLEIQVEERTHEIVEQKKLIEEKNKDITDSINYAKRIQDSILPEQTLLNSIFTDSFVLFKPKDIVSGDFYWFAEHKGVKIIAVADCTGHGVPGALMSMIGSNILNKLVLENGLTQPDLILNELHEEVRTALKQKENASETNDGMDIAIISITKDQLHYSGAHRPLYYITNNILQEIKADKFPIGGIQQEEKRIFTNHVLTLQQNDKIYLSSDGFADQFGGESGKKLMTKKFKELLQNIQHDSMITL
ncbi:MAG: SpoIIE family protein phosphatase [Bacteroidetes bacterium]|nr:SpoIIE family protein phosphatase [Bacteroidota bacterium]